MKHINIEEALANSKIKIPSNHPRFQIPVWGLVVALIGLVGSSLLGFNNPQQFYFSYLVSFLFFLSIALGALFFVLVQFATKAGWSVVVRRIAENIAGTLPLFLLLFIPLLTGMHELFHWSHADVVANDPLLQGKAAFLNTTFFTIRAVFYVACWTFLGWWYFRNSLKQDVSGDPKITHKLQFWSGPSLILFALTLTFASIDWIMSLDPHWYSTMYGVYFFAGCVVAIYAFMSIITADMQRTGLLKNLITIEHFHDLGKMLFAFVVFWSYIAFSQYLLIWYANIPEETVYYAHRMEGSWLYVGVTLMVGHFFIPFFYLMSRHVKRNKTLLLIGSVWMLGIHYVDLYYLVMPTLHAHDVHLSLLDLSTFLGIGGFFVASVGWIMNKNYLIPIKDPRLAESLAFENL
jgi:hypothetical protein